MEEDDQLVTVIDGSTVGGDNQDIGGDILGVHEKRIEADTTFYLTVNMRAAVFTCLDGFEAAAPKISKKALSTPLARGGGRLLEEKMPALVSSLTRLLC